MNDEVMDCFFWLLQKRDAQMFQTGTSPSKKRHHFFHCFFYPMLKTSGYNSIKKWSDEVPGGDIFDLHKIFIPINASNVHWFLAVIDMEQKTIQAFDSWEGLKITRRKCLPVLKKYLEEEHLAKKGIPLCQEEEWKLISNPYNEPPQ